MHAPLKAVNDFHSQSKSMAAITPPPIIIQMRNAPSRLAEGDEMGFTMWLGPIPLNWLARIEAVSDAGFTDRQVQGPFAEWEHRHRFVAVDGQTTEVRDEITLHVRSQPAWWLVGMGIRAGLPFLFAYRAWKTRKCLR